MRVTMMAAVATMLVVPAAVPAQMIGVGTVLTLREADASKGVIPVKLGQKARILLPTNPSTGFEWSYGAINNIGIDSPITIIPSESMIRPRPSGEVQPGATGQVPGSTTGGGMVVGGSEVALSRIQFRGLSGYANISFVYGRRPSNGQRPVAQRTVRFNFRVDP